MAARLLRFSPPRGPRGIANDARLADVSLATSALRRSRRDSRNMYSRGSDRGQSGNGRNERAPVWMTLSSRCCQNRFFSSTSSLGTTWQVSSPSAPAPSAPFSASRRILPRNILLLRHGRSLGNDDEMLFATTPDWKIPLSPQGRRQARAAGRKIREIVGPDERLVVYVSPYARTKETLECARSEWEDHSKKKKNNNNNNNNNNNKGDENLNERLLFIREEPRLREQDFGNFQDPAAMVQAKKERPEFGRFFYRFPNGGESGADVFDRVSAFCGTFQQDLEQVQQWQHHQHDGGPGETTALFVTHGITARLFVMRWLHWTVEDFETLYNPPNCGLLHLQRTPDGTAYRLTDESRALLNSPKERGLGRGLQLVTMEEHRRRGSPWWRDSDNDVTTFGSRRGLSEREDAWKGLPETAWGM